VVALLKSMHLVFISFLCRSMQQPDGVWTGVMLQGNPACPRYFQSCCPGWQPSSLAHAAPLTRTCYSSLLLLLLLLLSPSRIIPPEARPRLLRSELVLLCSLAAATASLPPVDAGPAVWQGVAEMVR
jgi:hypothetical protein